MGNQKIFLESELFYAGVRPAINSGISVSRVGGNAQIKAMKKIAGALKLAYSQYRELQAFAQFSSDLDKDTKIQLKKGERIVEILKQPQNSPMKIEHQVVIIYLAVNNFLLDIPVDKIIDFQYDFINYIENNYNTILYNICKTKDLTPEIEKTLIEAIGEFKKLFLNSSEG